MAHAIKSLEEELRDRYIDLLIDTLTFSLWPEPPMPLVRYRHRTSSLKRAIYGLVDRTLARFGYGVVRLKPLAPEARDEGKIWPGYADTMVGRKRMNNLRNCVETVLQEHVPGDLIETGVWRGGSCILMRGILAAYGATDRTVFVADSFQGLPKPETDKYEADRGDPHHIEDYLRVSEDQVRRNFERYGLLDEHVVFLKGWFKDTLPTAPIERLAVLRLDGDMYSSTIEAIEALYPKLSPGGFCIVDDYALEGCRKAIEDYRASKAITEPIQTVDWTGVFWRKAGG